MTDEFAATLRGAQAGEEWAVAVLWRDLNHRIVRFLRGRAGDAADDIASETWLTVTRKLHAFSGGEAEFRAWIFTIARSRLIDWQRHHQRRPAATGSPDALEGTSAPDDPAQDALDSLGTEGALALLAQLPPHQAEAILLRVVAGLDVARVARIVGKRPGTVRMLQHRGLQRLRDLVDTAERGQTERVAP